jgi:hypothetical protein
MEHDSKRSHPLHHPQNEMAFRVHQRCHVSRISVQWSQCHQTIRQRSRSPKQLLLREDQKIKREAKATGDQMVKQIEERVDEQLRWMTSRHNRKAVTALRDTNKNRHWEDTKPTQEEKDAELRTYKAKQKQMTVADL